LRFERFGLGIMKGMALTFKHLFRHPITTQYPEERLHNSRRLRGYELVWDSKKCTGCATCAKSCPQGNIEMLASVTPENTWQVEAFRLDYGRCMFCGLCVEVCPFGALHLGMNYEAASYLRRELLKPKEALLLTEDKKPSGYFRPHFEALHPKQTLLVYGERKGGS
jgi:NAD(P)H-quinone oxidoreductase subunit I